MRYARSLRLALGFLTRVPVGAVEARDGDFGRAVGAFPIVGALLGLGIAAAAWLLYPELSGALTAITLVAMSALLTGGLHLDGVADVFDGLSGGRGDRERTLEIMRDSRIGSHGAVALFVVLAAKAAASMELLVATDYVALALAPVVGRGLLAPVIVAVPYARERGLGSSFHEQAGLVHLLLPFAALGAGVAIGGVTALWALAAAASVVALFTAVLCRRLGGLTGDGYGALIELADISFLIACTVL